MSRQRGIWSGGINRRTVLKSAAAGFTGIGALALAGCGDSDKGGSDRTSTIAAAGSSTGSPSATPVKGGEYIERVVATAETLDPHVGQSAPFLHWPLISDRLIEPDRETVEPFRGALVDHWETPDATTVILHARDGVHFHGDDKITNGRAFTAVDIVFNVMRIGGKLDPAKAALFTRAALLNGLDSAVASDASTATITLSNPNALFLHGLAAFQNLVVPKELVDKDPDFKDPAGFTGTGPFILDGWDTTSTSGSFKANPDYWRAGEPYFASIKQASIPDDASWLSSFLSKQTQYLLVTPQNSSTIKSQRSDAKVVSWEFLNFDFFRLNNSRPQFTDVRVRQAIQLALNYEQLNDQAYGQGNWSYSGPLPSGMPGCWTSDVVRRKPGWDPDTKQQDLAEALKLLDAAGHAKGDGISFSIPPFPTPGSVYNDDPVRIQGQLQQAFPSMKVSLDQSGDLAAWRTRLAKGDWDAVTFSQYPNGFSAATGAASSFRSNSPANATKFSDSTVDTLIGQVYSETDADSRNKLIGDLEQRLADLVAIIPLRKPKFMYAWDPKIGGFDTYVGPGRTGGLDMIYGAHEMWLRS